MQRVETEHSGVARQKGGGGVSVVRLPPPPSVVADLLIVDYLRDVLSCGVRLHVLQSADRGCHGGKQPFIWRLGKNKFSKPFSSPLQVLAVGGGETMIRRRTRKKTLQRRQNDAEST